MRVLNVWEAYQLTVRLYASNYMRFWKLMLVAFIPAHVVAAILQVYTYPDGFHQSPFRMSQPTISTDDAGLLLLGIALVSLTIALATALATAAGIALAARAYREETLDTAAAWTTVNERLGSVLGWAVVTGIAIVAGFLAFIVPGIYLAVAWSVALPAVLLESIGAFPSLGRSRSLVRGRWWPTAGFLLLVWLSAGLISGAFSIPAALLPLFGIDDNLVVAVVGGFFGILGSTIATPAYAAALTVAFFDLRNRRLVESLPPPPPRISPPNPAPPPSP